MLKRILLTAILLASCAAAAAAQELGAEITGAPASSGGGGSGISGLTTGTIPKAASATTLADSLLSDDATTLLYTGTNLKVGSSGFRLKNSSATAQVRNSADSAFAPLSSSTVLLNGATSGVLTLAANAVTTNYSLTYPAAVSATANNALVWSVAGVASWATGTPSALTYLRGDGSWATPAGGGSPAGSSGDLQYNNAGAFGAAIVSQGTDTISVKNGAGAEELRVYGNASVYYRVTASPTVTEAVTTDGQLNLGTYTNYDLRFVTLGTYRWDITGSGHLMPHASDTYDFGDTSHLVRNIFQSGYLLHTEVAANPVAADIAAIGGAAGQGAVYLRANKLVVAYNNAGTMTYLTVPLDGATTTWTQSTVAP